MTVIRSNDTVASEAEQWFSVVVYNGVANLDDNDVWVLGERE